MVCPLLWGHTVNIFLGGFSMGFYNYREPYHFVKAQNRKQIDLTLNGIPEALSKAVAVIRDDSKVIVEKERYTVLTRYSMLAVWQKIRIGMEIAKIPSLRVFRDITLDSYGRIKSSRLFMHIKDKKARK